MTTRTVEITTHLNRGAFGSMDRTHVTFHVEQPIYGPISPLYPEWVQNQSDLNKTVQKLVAEGWTKDGSEGQVI
jgi:hypothetical protein